MTAHSDPNAAKRNADDFIERLGQETGVSRRFLEEARPVIERAFAEVPEDRLSACLETIRFTVQMQAETEASLRRSLEQSQQLIRSEEALYEKLHTLKEEALLAKEKVATAALGLFRWQNPSFDSN